MNVYTVHLKGSPEDLAVLERAVFVREGFSWPALIFGPLWLLWNRLWLALAIWLVFEAGLVAWGVFGSPASSVIIALELLMHLALAFEAAQVRRAALTRRRFQFAGLAHGQRLTDAEQSYFARAHAAYPPAMQEPASVPGRARAPDMVGGLFPSAGA
jgi:hypothetical protein